MKIITKLSLIVVFLCALCHDVFSQWTISRDFEGGTVGQTATGPSGFFWVNSGNMKFSNTRANSGTKSVSALFPGGSADQTGATFEGNNAYVSEGGEVWFREYLYFPAGFNFSTAPVQKIFRISTTSGYLSVYNINGKISMSNEPSVFAGYDEPGTQASSNVNFSTGQWQCIEMYVKLNHTLNQGIFRIWKDGILILEDKHYPTLANSNARVNDIFTQFNYWNGGSPATQTAYVDDIKITNVTPSNVDTQGNRMIGPIGGTSCGGPDPWTNTSFTQQTGAFTADFDVIPSGNNVDGVVGLSNSAAGTYADLACIVRFNINGSIDARNGAFYQATSKVPYVAGTSCHVKMNVNLNTKKYDVYVTPQGGSQQTIASQYDFRTEQNTISQLNNWAKNTASCSLDVKNFTSGITTSVKADLNNMPFPLKIYPNPVSEQLTVEIISAEAQTISILDLLGRELIKKNITENQTIMDVTGLTDGIYMIIIKDKNGNKLGAEKISVLNR